MNWDMLQDSWTFENIMLSESRLHRATYCTVPFMWNTQNRQIHRDRKYISVCQRRWVWAVMSTGFLFGVVKTLENGCWWLHNIVNMQKTPELYNWIGWILWYVNYSSKLLKKNMDLQASFLEILLSLWLTPNLYFKQLPWWSQCSKRLGWAEGGGWLMYLETSPESYLSCMWRKRCQQRRFKMSNAARKATTVQVPRKKTILTSPQQMPQVPCRPFPPPHQLPLQLLL